MLPEKNLKMSKKGVIIMGSKFNDAVYIARESLPELIEIEDLFSIKENNEVLFNEIKDFLFCSECHKAKLKLAYTEQRQYLSANSTESHSQECSYYLKRIPLKQLKKLYENQESPQKIQNQLQVLLNNFNLEDELQLQPTINNINSFKEKKAVIFSSTDNTTKYHLPKQKIGRKNGDNFDEGKIKLYYGRVKIKVSENEIFFNIHLYNITDSMLIASVAVNKSYQGKENLVWKYLQNSLNQLLNNEIYDLGFFGSVNKKGVFNNFFIKHSEHLLIRKV